MAGKVRISPEIRFMSKVVHDGVTTCWHWAGNTNMVYGVFAIRRTKVLAHRYAYKTFKGPIPDGLCLDHLCRNKLCVNPSHLRPVTHKENMLAIPEEIRKRGRRKDACKRGHPFTEENTTILDGRYGTERDCKTCRQMHYKNYRARKAAAAGKTIQPWKKLADADVSLLREMIADAGGKYGTAAKHFGISTAQAWRIANFQRRRAA